MNTPIFWVGVSGVQGGISMRPDFFRKPWLLIGKAFVCLCVSGSAAAQSYGDLESIRKSSPGTYGRGTDPTRAPHAPRQDHTGSFSSQFNQGMAKGERQTQQQRETSAADAMRTQNMIDRPRSSARAPDARGNDRAAVHFDNHGPMACKADPLTHRYECGAVGKEAAR
ncbi:hypothetical protein [Paraburkholderia unamae]|uniref:hypothetical protein n=1 Tax=Paraburkholderia unamae TaxID=219649 RepID=UPI001CC67DC0|nr:hypothetical protein [Paraburkholderia unamae]